MFAPNISPKQSISKATIFLAGLCLLWLTACTGIGLNPATPTPFPTSALLSAIKEPTTTPTPEPSQLPTETPSPLPTSTSEELNVEMPAQSTTPTTSPTKTPPPSNTPRPSRTPSPSPTSQPQFVPTVATFQPASNPERGPTATPPTTIPTAVPTFEMPAGTTNILLLGTDVDQGDGVTRSDTIIIASVNRREKTASMISLPRDLYVHIPGWTMARINQAVARGRGVGHPGGGIGQLKDTILYNFGIPIHYYAEIDFDGFKQIIDALGGVEIAVSCQLTDWRLKSPELNIHVEENWEQFTLEPDIHTMDGHLALWYARSRKSTSDFDRNRRQQQLLHAILNQGVDLDRVKDAPALWNAFQDTIKTDMDIGRALQLASVAAAVRENGIQHLYLVNSDIIPWTIPGSGSTVYLPNWFTANETFSRLFIAPSLNRSTRKPIRVEVINHSGDEVLGQLALDGLAWYGLIPVLAEADGVVEDQTKITYYGQNFKGSYDWLVSWIFNKRRSGLILNSEDSSEFNYQIVLGQDYNPCRPRLFGPRENIP